jgi:hypothetical protein
VFAILLNVSRGATWKEAFLEVLPQRKGAKEKESASEESKSPIIEEVLSKEQEDEDLGEQKQIDS